MSGVSLAHLCAWRCRRTPCSSSCGRPTRWTASVSPRFCPSRPPSARSRKPPAPRVLC